MPFRSSSFACTLHCIDRHRMVDSQSFCKCPCRYYFFFPFEKSSIFFVQFHTVKNLLSKPTVILNPMVGQTNHYLELTATNSTL